MNRKKGCVLIEKLNQRGDCIYIPVDTLATVVQAHQNASHHVLEPLKTAQELGDEAEEEWDSFCRVNSMVNKPIPTAHKKGEERPDRLTNFTRWEASVEIKALTSNAKGELELVDEFQREGKLSYISNVSEEVRRISGCLEKSGRQHREYSQSTQRLLPTVTVLVDKRVAGSQRNSLVDMVSSMLYGEVIAVAKRDNLEKVGVIFNEEPFPWKKKVLESIGFIGILNKGLLTLYENPYASEELRPCTQLVGMPKVKFIRFEDKKEEIADNLLVFPYVPGMLMDTLKSSLVKREA